MQYRHEIGHALANFATQRILSEKLRFSCFSQVPTGSDCPSYRLHCIIRLCFSFSTILRFVALQVPTGLGHPSYRLILQFAFTLQFLQSFTLHAFGKYRRAQIALFHTYTASVASIIDFYNSSLRRLSVSFGGSITPLATHTAIRFNSLIVTILHFIGAL